jgi:hypothetical protein
VFNSFLCTFLNIFQVSFPVKYSSMKKKMTRCHKELKISCKYKTSLYTFIENNSDPKTKTQYIKFCQIVRKFINKAKKQHYSRCRAKSNNKIKTAWDIIKKEMGKVHSVEQVSALLVNNKKLKDSRSMANAFSNY